MNRVILPLGDTGRANDRVIRVTNVHFDTTEEDLRKFFSQFIIVDQIRDKNVRTGTNSVVYVLFATQRERIESAYLDGQRIHDRRVKIQPAPTGTYIIKDDYSGFVRKNEAPPASSSQTPGNAVLQLDRNSFPALRPAPRRDINSLLQADPLQSRILFMNGVHQDAKENDIRAYFGSFAIADMQRTIHPKSGKYMQTAFILLASAQDRVPAMQQLKGIKMHGRIVTLEVPKKFVKGFEESLMSDPQQPVAYASPIDRPTVYGDTHEPANISSVPLLDENWNLSRNKNNMFISDEWNNFQADLARKERDELEQRETVADRINREGGRDEIKY